MCPDAARVRRIDDLPEQALPPSLMLHEDHTPRTNSTIRRLADAVINQIAAGEVVDRPAGILKELMENAMDAGATRIEVHLLEGGLREIRVLDNGRGMSRSDLDLCMERHTTSKIVDADDLEALTSYGFRGEALSSIASVARLSMSSRRQSDPHGLRRTMWGGDIIEDGIPQGMGEGTHVTVSEIFERVPARKKFLKSAATELQHCVRHFKLVAMARPDLEFLISHNAKLLYHLRPTLEASRYAEIAEPSWKPLEIVAETDGVALYACLSPSDVLQDRGEVFFLINRRPIQSRALLGALKTAYELALGPHHHPSGLVRFDVRPDWVDANVHPQKWEVRLLFQERIIPWLISNVRKELAAAPVVRTVELPTHTDDTTQPRWPQNQVHTPEDGRVWSVSEGTTRPLSEPHSALLPLQDERLAPKPGIETLIQHGDMRYLGQIDACFLVCELRGALILVDQHALHEKIRFEELVTAFRTHHVSAQRMLIPKVLQFFPEDLGVLLAHRDTLARFGIEIEPFGEREIAVQACPTSLHLDQIDTMLRELVKLLSDSDPTLDIERVFHPVLATVACHSVVRRGQQLSEQEAKNLLASIGELQEGWTCPHGRPVSFQLPLPSIRKYFERT